MVEFALIAPVMLITLFGMFDFGHGMYVRALLQGAIDKASRDSTIQGATTATLDAKVTSIVRQITPGRTPSGVFAHLLHQFHRCQPGRGI